MTDLEQARKRWIAEQPQYEKLGIELAYILKREVRSEGIWAEVTN